ncbi:hypothetical protein [Chryseobacterium sp.]|uniref:hypothetical protein n=1 Tax=Chryseobacterium sp. TaxID=1871047 RepID=UPI0011CBF300|nr:hypothetical protein [Chryseobacterium sp.]TXF79329.1 hypothetical protein FUA25_02785 [Chryseobacterium sp.]
MKYLLELILATVIIFFVWNILKRIFLTRFYRNFPSAFNQKKEPDNSREADKKVSQKVKWDAETVDYEEIKENNDYKK